MGQDVSKAGGVHNAMYKVAFYDDPGKREQLCKAFGDMPAYKAQFEEMKKNKGKHVGAAIGWGFAGNIPGAVAEGLKAGSFELYFLAHCVRSEEKKQGRPQVQGPKTTLDPGKLPGIQLDAVCKTLMQEEKMAADYAVMKAVTDCQAAKIVAFIDAIEGGGAGDASLDPSVAETIMEIKETVSDVKEGIQATKDIEQNKRAFLYRCMRSQVGRR